MLKDWLDTNLSGIVETAVQAEVERQLAAAGARLDAVLACGFHPEGAGALRRATHPWRKPGPGMLLAAAERMGLDLGRSWIVGDQARDIEAGRAAGLAGGLRVGADDVGAAMALASGTFRTLGAKSLLDGLPQLPL